jgi:hypothetical protein
VPALVIDAVANAYTAGYGSGLKGYRQEMPGGGASRRLGRAGNNFLGYLTLAFASAAATATVT